MGHLNIIIAGPWMIWMRTNPGKTLATYEIPQLVNQAFIRAMNPLNILSGFQATGIFPYNREVFQDIDYAPALVTDRPESRCSKPRPYYGNSKCGTNG